MLELALAELVHLSPGDERQYYVGRKALFYGGLDAEGVCGVDQNACVMRSDHRVDNCCEIVDIGEGFHAEDNVVERAIAGLCGVFGISYNCGRCVSVIVFRVGWLYGVPCRGLNRSLPNTLDLEIACQGMIALEKRLRTHLKEIPY